MSDEKKYHHGNLKPALVEAGLAILEEEGLEKLSLRACAERVGVSHTAPKNHFGNLTGLLTAIAAEGQMRLHHQMKTGDGTSRKDRRLAAFRGYAAFARANPALFELMFSRRKLNFADPTLARALSANADVLRQASDGTATDSKHAQMVDWCLVHGFATLTNQGVFDKDGMRDLGIDDLLPALSGPDDD